MRSDQRPHRGQAPTITDLEIGLISPRRHARRPSPKRIGQLADSVKAIGLQAPLVVRATNGGAGVTKYEILAGRHRYEACRFLKMKSVPCIIVAADGSPGGTHHNRRKPVSGEFDTGVGSESHSAAERSLRGASSRDETRFDRRRSRPESPNWRLWKSPALY